MLKSMAEDVGDDEQETELKKSTQMLLSQTDLLQTSAVSSNLS